MSRTDITAKYFKKLESPSKSCSEGAWQLADKTKATPIGTRIRIQSTVLEATLDVAAMLDYKLRCRSCHYPEVAYCINDWVGDRRRMHMMSGREASPKSFICRDAENRPIIWRRANDEDVDRA
jgi:hypothetical protein